MRFFIHAESADYFRFAASQAPLHGPAHDSVNFIPTQSKLFAHRFWLACLNHSMANASINIVNRLPASAQLTFTVFGPCSRQGSKRNVVSESQRDLRWIRRFLICS